MLRGTIVYRTCGIHKNIPGMYLTIYFYKQYLVLSTMPPRTSSIACFKKRERSSTTTTNYPSGPFTQKGRSDETRKPYAHKKKRAYPHAASLQVGRKHAPLYSRNGGGGMERCPNSYEKIPREETLPFLATLLLLLLLLVLLLL